MNTRYRLLAGPFAAAIFFLGILALPWMIPGYSQIHQTLSEIGEVGSPARVPFTLMLFVVASCMLIFASGLRRAAAEASHSPLAAYLTACSALSAAGMGVFAYPHPLHNYVGLSELIGYQAPLALAITWRRDPRATSVVRLSWIMSIAVWVAIVLNVSTLDRTGALWAYEKPVYGLFQRALFVVWFCWVAAIGAMLSRAGGDHALAEAAPTPVR